MYKISVIVPVYNSEKYLDRCVKSVINQTYQNWELLLIDDGSTDESGKMCDHYAASDNRIKTVHQKNARIGAARNRGLDMATGDCITFIDSDDYIEPDTYEKSVELMVKYNADLVQWDCEYFFDDGKSAADLNRKKDETAADAIIVANSVQAMRMCVMRDRGDERFNNIQMCSHCVWTKMGKKEIFEGVRFPVGKEYEDEAMLHYLYYNSKVTVFVNRRFSHYLLRDNSTVHTMPLKGTVDHVDAYDDRVRLVEKMGNIDLIKCAYNHYELSYIQCYSRAMKEKNKVVCQDMLARAKRLFNEKSKYLSVADRFITRMFTLMPNVMVTIYTIYRKSKN
ncbi:glycosyltransferase family 2 protein [Ruminococcus sp. 5_1_39BFAA]|uniref:glycosyltransferase family 2 protein n=1 Tax=Ruminococcus sp. 5_1_39BFAA TaxID=457412 RepID=UPI003569EE69